jgi:hypothetical protein
VDLDVFVHRSSALFAHDLCLFLLPLGVGGPFMFGGSFHLHFVIRNWQDEVFGDLGRLGEGGQLRLRATTNDLFSAPLLAREDLLRKRCRLDLFTYTPMTCPLHFWNYGRRFIVNSDPDEPKKAT